VEEVISQWGERERRGGSATAKAENFAKPMRRGESCRERGIGGTASWAARPEGSWIRILHAGIDSDAPHWGDRGVKASRETPYGRTTHQSGLHAQQFAKFSKSFEKTTTTTRLPGSSKLAQQSLVSWVGEALFSKLPQRRSPQRSHQYAAGVPNP